MLLTKAQVATLLGRSLTTAEDTNFTTYIKIAEQRLQELLCMDLCGDGGERTYDTRYGYRTVYVDPFTDMNSVSIDDEEVSSDDYIIKQNDKYNGSWYNIIEFDTMRTGQRIVVDAEWGFGTMPVDLQLLLARLFAQGTVEQTSDSQVKSKKIEDFTVTFKDSATYDEFVLSNSATIGKYSQCNQSTVRHGSVWGYHDLRSIRSY